MLYDIPVNSLTHRSRLFPMKSLCKCLFLKYKSNPALISVQTLSSLVVESSIPYPATSSTLHAHMYRFHSHQNDLIPYVKEKILFINQYLINSDWTDSASGWTFDVIGTLVVFAHPKHLIISWLLTDIPSRVLTKPNISPQES